MKINTSKKMIYIISASVAAVILIGLIVYFCLSTGKDKTDGEPNPTAGVSSAAEETEITATETELTPEETEVVAEPVETEPTEPEPTEPEPTEPPHVHNYKAEWTKGVTCTENGYTHYVCSCGHSYNGDFIRAIGEHSWGGWITIKEPTTTNTGLKQCKCNKCGKTITETIPVIATWDGDNASIRNVPGEIDNLPRPEGIDASFRVDKFESKISYDSDKFKIVVNDRRAWGKAPNIIIDENNKTVTVSYTDKDGEVQSTTLPLPDSEHFMYSGIQEDGSFAYFYMVPWQ